MERTHVITIYSWEAGAVEDEYGKTSEGWALVVDDVEVNLQPLTGSVAQSAAGRQVDSTYRLFGPAPTPFAPDQGVVVKSVLPAGQPYYGPTAFRIRQVGPQGTKWDTEVLLEDTQEAIPAEEAPVP